MSSWIVISGSSQDIEGAGLRAFFNSPYYLALPSTSVRAHLWTDLLIGPSKFTKSDAMDIDMLSAALPISNFVLADKRMCQRIQRLKLDQAWNARVFSLSTCDQLLEELEALKP